MPPPSPFTLIAELSYQCPLHCPYCSNPLDIGDSRHRRELETEDWLRVFREARGLGVLQLALTGGEPMLRRDLVALCEGARDAGLYSSLITAGTLFTRERAEALKAAGLDHVQISIQSPNPEDNDRIAGNRSFEKKIAAARAAKELGFPLTINCVLHHQNLDRIEELLDLTLELGAQRLELANTQYYGWAVVNQAALMPSWEQLRRGEEAVRRFRERVGPAVDVLWVLPDYYEELPKPCMGGWGRTAMVVAPGGDVLPCQAASTIPGLEFASVREHPLGWIWNESDAFARFRGTGWMQEPCRSCPLGRQEEDWGGCRCQALRLTGDAAATDPVCQFSPHHERVVSARESVQTAPRSGAADDSPKASPSGAADHPAKAPPLGAADHPAKAPPSGAADHPQFVYRAMKRPANV
ncbi:MAG TPA: pyrroloquinoline quinone biosynthesis protein PqqE [Solirubrobacteraceae bacterium]|nr:pyrroloquinoline quinone biosynthesis protein PqqE [Solirubrobacteraceae bacterium]